MEREKLLKELEFSFVRSSGPGGQNVNKVSTVVQLRFDVVNSKLLNEEVKEKILKKEKRRISKEGILVIEAKRFRTQEKNREDAVDRLIKIIQTASQKMKPRRPSKPTKQSKEKRLKEKKIKGEIKKLRSEKFKL